MTSWLGLVRTWWVGMMTPQMTDPRAVILMGVSGCGKSSVGKALSEILDWPFFDADDFHPEANVAKMAAGRPLDDNDRAPWLQTLHDLIHEHLARGASLILACSALKQKYRARLAEGNPGTMFVYLHGDFDLIYQRMVARSRHFMRPEMVRTQFKALEEPKNAIRVQIDQPIGSIADEIIRQLQWS